MLSLHFRIPKVTFIIITVLMLLICVCGINAESQVPVLQSTRPKIIRVGIRTAAFPIGNFQNGKYGGFCVAFMDELKNELSRENLEFQVVPLPKPLENQYRGQNYPRFGALLNNTADIECGPNSTSSLNLKINNSGSKTFGDEIEFSANSFYTTGVKLLLKKDAAEELEKASSTDRAEKLRYLSIAVLRQTTTLQEFEKHKQYYENYVPYPNEQLENQKNDVRDLILDKLETGEVPAFASDAVILKTLFKQGVLGEHEFQEPREPYEKKNDYAIYPSKGYLPYLGKQKCAIAIKKNTPYLWLKGTIDKVLVNPNLRQAKEDIKNYESMLEPVSFPPQSPSASPTSHPGDKGDKPAGDNSWVAILVAVISAAGVVIAAFLNRKKV